MPKRGNWISIDQAAAKYEVSAEQLVADVLGGDLRSAGGSQGQGEVQILEAAVRKKYYRRRPTRRELVGKAVAVVVFLAALMAVVVYGRDLWEWTFGPTPDEIAEEQAEMAAEEVEDDRKYQAAIRYAWDRVNRIREDLDGKCPDLRDEQRAAVDKRLVEATEGLSEATTWQSAAAVGDDLHVTVFRTLYPDCPWSAVDPRTFDDLPLLEEIFDPSQLGS